MIYESHIGLEVHIQLKTASKAFCGCQTSYGDEPNSHICPVCMGYPGSLPCLNQEALRMAALSARAFNCQLAPISSFERKQYFYPDMPKNYQITQVANPIGTMGWIDIQVAEGLKRIRIKDAHLEEDAGKMIHAGQVSWLDYNRAGTPLLELVTEPDFTNGRQAENFLQLIRRTVRYLGVSDGNLEEGSLRCDANISLNPPGAGLGQKVELKNLNSSRFVRLALEYEIRRQSRLLAAGQSVPAETRLWNDSLAQTELLRTKALAEDYRILPEADLPAFVMDKAFLTAVEAALVELPLAKEVRFKHQYGLRADQAAFLCEDVALADYFESATAALTVLNKRLSKNQAAHQLANWLASDIRRLMKQEGLEAAAIADFGLSPERLAKLISLRLDGRVSGTVAKQLLEAVIAEDADPEALLIARGWEQIHDQLVISHLVDEVWAAESQALATIKANDQKLLVYLTGRVIAASQGRADPSLVRQILLERLATG